MRFCSNCGANLQDGVKFCTECGAKVEVAPAEPVYEAPAAPVQTYEPPVQTYEPPVQTYEPPVQTYEPPVQTYEPPVQQTYTPPVQTENGGSYTPPPAPPKAEKPAKAPKAPKAGKSGGKKLLPIIIGAVAVVILLVILLGGGKDQGTEADWGVYEGVSCVVSGMDLGAEDEWIELQKKGKATLGILGDEFNAKWTLDGENIVIKQGGDEFAGTLKNGVLEVDMAGMLYTFAKHGAAAAPETNEPAATLTPTEKEPEEPAKADGPVTYKLVSFTSGGEELGSDMVEMMGGGYVVFNGDGTGMFSMFGETFPITYDGSNMDAGGEKMAYTISDGGMEFDMQGDVYKLEVTDETPDLSAPPADFGDEEEVTGIQAWAGDYYGYWVIDSVWEASTDWVEEGAYWDCCATVEINADGTGTMTIWDEDFTKDEPLAELGITVSETGGVARFCSEEGSFMGAPLEHADWLWYTDGTEYGDMFLIDGEFADDVDDFWYYICLRPWGADWSDVEANGEEIPYYYYDWYLPLVEDGVTEAPEGNVAG